MRLAYAVNGGIQAFGALTPIIAEREQVLRDHLRFLDGASPMAAVQGTHYARLLIISRFPCSGLRRPEKLCSQYLMFSTCFDGTDLATYLDQLSTSLGPAADEVWGNCVGYGGQTDLRRYLLHNRIDPLAVYVQYPGETVSSVKEALRLQRQLRRFVIDHQHESDPATLRTQWVAEFGAGPMGAA